MEREEIFYDDIIDCVGLYCPMPVVKAKLKLEEMEKGKVLKILADDPTVEEDFPSWCKMVGEELIAIEKNRDGIYSIYIRKNK